jgi:hypothetical protein
VDTTVGALCLPTAQLCPDRKDFVFWDAYHTDHRRHGRLRRRRAGQRNHRSPRHRCAGAHPRAERRRHQAEGVTRRHYAVQAEGVTRRHYAVQADACRSTRGHRAEETESCGRSAAAQAVIKNRQTDRPRRESNGIEAPFHVATPTRTP